MPSTAAPTIRNTYRTQAVVDWIDVAITTARSTQFQWIQKELRHIINLPREAPQIHVEPMGSGPGAAGHRFKIRLHDALANSLRDLRVIVAQLGERFGLAQPAEVVGIEIALDFYSKGKGDLRAMTARLQSSIAAYEAPRQYEPQARSTRLWRADDLNTPEADSVDPAGTLYIGHKTSSVQWRVYLKRTDNGQQPLPAEAHRARAEFTLDRAWLQAHKHGSDFLLDDLAQLQFEDLASLLHFRRFKPVAEIVQDKSSPFVQVIQKTAHHTRGSVAGYPFGRIAYLKDNRTGKPRNRGYGKALEHSSHTVADEELNRLVRERLKALTAKFRT